MRRQQSDASAFSLDQRVRRDRGPMAKPFNLGRRYIPFTFQVRDGLKNCHARIGWRARNLGHADRAAVAETDDVGECSPGVDSNLDPGICHSVHNLSDGFSDGFL